MAVLQLYGDEDTDGNDVQTKPSPPKPATSTHPKPVDPDAVAKWDKIRLKLLNRLNAAPGQPAREFIKDYLVSRGWIKAHQEPEDWPTAHIPTAEDTAKELFSNIQMFERRRNEQALTEEQV